MTNSSAVLVLLVASVSIASCGGGGDKSPTPPPPSPVLTTVSVSLGSSTIHVGQSTQASATGLDQNNASIATGLVSWSSSSPGVASISAGGTITAITAGTTFIFGAAGNVAGQAALTVLPVSIATVAVTPAGTTIYVGQTKQLTATPADAGGNPLAGRVVTWSSADSTKATVSSTGLVTALAAGSVSISALSEGVTGSATITIALVPVASVTVAPAAQTIAPGQSVQVTATTKDSVGGVLQGRAVVWSTNNPAAASISAPGNPATVLGNAVGTATVTATSEGKSGSSTITVSGSAPTVVVTSVSPAPLTPGVVATVSGTGFSATPSSNAVTIEGVSVPVTAATTTQLSFRVAPAQ